MRNPETGPRTVAVTAHSTTECVQLSASKGTQVIRRRRRQVCCAGLTSSWKTLVDIGLIRRQTSIDALRKAETTCTVGGKEKQDFFEPGEFSHGAAFELSPRGAGNLVRLEEK